MMIPNDSNHPPSFSPSISENIDSLAQMLLGSSHSYEAETCRLLLEKIKEKILLTPHIEASLETIEKAIQNPTDFESLAIQQAFSSLRGI